MDVLRQIGGSILLAMFSIALVIGGISLALAESYVPEIPPTPTITPTLAPVFVFNTPTAQPIVLPTQTLFIPSATVPPPTSCPPPAGWVPVTVGPGDTLTTLALEHKISSAQLSVANCLFSNNLPTGSIIYVPPVPTRTSIPCGPPPGWVRYTVRFGDTITSLSQAFGVSISQIQFANCMASNQYYIAPGQSLWVPNLPTRTPRATSTATLTPISIVFPTITRSPTPSPTASATPSATNTSSASNTPIATNVPTSTSTGTATGIPATSTWTSPPPTATPTATATITASPSSTPTTPAPSQ